VKSAYQDVIRLQMIMKEKSRGLIFLKQIS